MDGEHSGWGTSAEIDFLKGLGSFSAVGSLVSPADLLKGYIVAIEHRVRFEKISKQEVVAFAQRRLAEIESNPETLNPETGVTIIEEGDIPCQQESGIGTL